MLKGSRVQSSDFLELPRIVGGATVTKDSSRQREPRAEIEKSAGEFIDGQRAHLQLTAPSLKGKQTEMLRNLVLLFMLLLQESLSASPSQAEVGSEQTELPGVLERVREAYQYVQEAYNEALQSVTTSQPWKTASETLPTGFLVDALSGTKAAMTKVKEAGGTLLDFAGMYYKDHIKPATSHYVKQASNTTASLWEGISKQWDDFWSF
ncbi:hypothetical protein GN956_G25667 [Arapaima gigas]